MRRLEQVFFNLIGNALKFTPSGGRVTINASAQGTQAHVRVTDTGVGIEPAFLPHVFDRFRQADSATTRTYGGLGLGLSIAKQLVDAHKGSISVTSEGKGSGATFIVALPVASPAPAAAAVLVLGFLGFPFPGNYDITPAGFKTSGGLPSVRIEDRTLPSLPRR